MPRTLQEAPSRLPPLALLLLSIAALYFARDIFTPLTLAVLLAFLLTPAVRVLESLRLGRVPAVIVVLAVAIMVGSAVTWTVVNQLVDVINQLPGYRANIERKIESFEGPHDGSLAQATKNVQELSKELSSPETKGAVPALPRHPSQTQKMAPPASTRPTPVEVVEPPPNALQSMRNIAGPLLLPLGKILIVVVFAVVMLIKREDLRSRILRLFGLGQLNLVTQAFDDASDRVSRYLRMQFLVNASFAGLISTGLYCIGLPSALLWGVLAGLMRFIPYVGPILGGSMPFIVALAVFPGWTVPLATVGLFLVTEIVVAYIIEPWLYGSHTGLSSLAILVAAIFWTTLWGPVGLVLSTPLTACLVVLGRWVPQLEFLYVLLGDAPVLPPEAELYQRLLALDRQEARAVIDRYSSEKRPVEVYDELIIPALALAEEDRHRGMLDDRRERFIIEGISEFIETLTDYEQRVFPMDGPNAGRVICLPASDEADEATVVMLTHALTLAAVPAIGLSLAEVQGETLHRLSLERGDIICVSALPPFALLSARRLSKELRERFPQAGIIVGIWSNTQEEAGYEERVAKAFDVAVVHTLAQAVARVVEMRPEDKHGVERDVTQSALVRPE